MRKIQLNPNFYAKTQKVTKLWQISKFSKNSGKCSNTQEKNSKSILILPYIMIKNSQTCDKRIRQFVAEEHFSEFNANS